MANANIDALYAGSLRIKNSVFFPGNATFYKWCETKVAHCKSSRPSPSSYEKATHGKLVGPTLSTSRGDKYYNQYRPLCEVCPRDRGKVVGTLQGYVICINMKHVSKNLNWIKKHALDVT